MIYSVPVLSIITSEKRKSW